MRRRAPRPPSTNCCGTEMAARPASLDAVELARALIRRPSVTPDDAGALDVLAEQLAALGFSCHRLRFEQAGTPAIDNLYARIGTNGRNFCFAGPTEGVPVGRGASWGVEPLRAELPRRKLYG